jgi:hypothetical protein
VPTLQVDAAAAYASQLLASAQAHKSVQTALELKARAPAQRRDATPPRPANNLGARPNEIPRPG